MNAKIGRAEKHRHGLLFALKEYQSRRSPLPDMTSSRKRLSID